MQMAVSPSTVTA